MIRKKVEIEREIKEMKEQLDTKVAECIKLEEMHNRGIKELEEKIGKLRSETCLEYTIEGRIQLLEKTAFNEIDRILKELSTATGRSYRTKPTSHYSFGPTADEFGKIYIKEGY